MAEFHSPSESQAHLLPLNQVVLGKMTDQAGITHEITAAQVMAGTDWKSIRVLSSLKPFSSDQALRSFALDVPDLNPWVNSIPEADSPAERVRFVTAYLKPNSSTDGRNALEIFLRALPLSSQAPKQDNSS